MRRKRRVRNHNEIDYLPAEKTAMRALVEALKILGAQWCFAEAYDLGEGMRGRTYRTLYFATSETILDDEAKCGGAEVYIHKSERRWIATAAEVSVPEGRGFFHFKWEDGRIIDTQKIEDQGLDWRMNVWEPQVNCLDFDPEYNARNEPSGCI